MNLNSSNRLVRTRMLGGVAGAEPNGSPLCRLSCQYVLFGRLLFFRNISEFNVIFDWIYGIEIYPTWKASFATNAKPFWVTRQGRWFATSRRAEVVQCQMA